jgi:fructose-specific PTS system IIA-like component
MALEHRFLFPLPNGLHARPASHLEEIVRGFTAAITFANDRTGRTANAKSVLALVGTDTRHSDPCRVIFQGADEAAAFSRLTGFLSGSFASCDEPLVIETPAASDELRLPRSLNAAGLQRFHRGTSACRGVGQGRAVVIGAFVVPPVLSTQKAGDAADEHGSFQTAATAVQNDLEHSLNLAHATEAAVLKAHLAILRDPALAGQVTVQIEAGRTAAQAVVAAIEANAAILRQAESAYLRERVLDLEDIGRRLLEKLGGPGSASQAPALTGPSVVLAATLTPGQLLALDRRHVRGLVLGHAGQTSHTIILARSFGIPTLTGVAPTALAVAPGTDTIVDANLGIVIIDIPPGVQRWYGREQAKLNRIAQTQAGAAAQLTVTRDRRRIEVAANISSAEEAVVAFAQGAEGIGLFRTELLFMNRSEAPGEEEQYVQYAAVVRAAAGRPVIIRTLDIGGDKPVPFLKFPPENNPFLGYRGVRFYAEHRALVKTQFRALLRAAALGPLKVMVPMVACLEEARTAKRLFTEAQQELAAAGVAHGHDVPFGLMVEVPSAAFILDELCTEADFFSIGTNDLTQYFLAADRENPKVANLYSSLHPGFLRLLQQIVTGVKARGRWIGLCGEMAEDVQAQPLLVGLGLDEISLAAPRIASTKAALAELASAECAALLDRALRCATRDEVAQLLAARPVSAVSLLTPELVAIDLDCRTKAEAIRAAVDLLEVAGRTTRPELIEEEIWQREDTYSTGFGGGLAVPHCKSPHLTANSIAILKSREGIEWGSVDGQPVRVAILLAIRADDHGKEHLKVFAKLSRLVVRDEFRDRLMAETDPAGLTDFVLTSLNS